LYRESEGERERERSARKEDRQHTCTTTLKYCFLGREGQNKNNSSCIYFDLPRVKSVKSKKEG